MTSGVSCCCGCRLRPVSLRPLLVHVPNFNPCNFRIPSVALCACPTAPRFSRLLLAQLSSHVILAFVSPPPIALGGIQPPPFLPPAGSKASPRGSADRERTSSTDSVVGPDGTCRSFALRYPFPTHRTHDLLSCGAPAAVVPPVLPFQPASFLTPVRLSVTCSVLILNQQN